MPHSAENIVVLDSGNSLKREDLPLAMIAPLVQRMRFLVGQVSVFVMEKFLTSLYSFLIPLRNREKCVRRSRRKKPF
jgi:hypothetical protein